VIRNASTTSPRNTVASVRRSRLRRYRTGSESWAGLAELHRPCRHLGRVQVRLPGPRPGPTSCSGRATRGGSHSTCARRAIGGNDAEAELRPPTRLTSSTAAWNRFLKSSSVARAGRRSMRDLVANPARDLASAERKSRADRSVGAAVLSVVVHTVSGVKPFNGGGEFSRQPHRIVACVDNSISMARRDIAPRRADHAFQDSAWTNIALRGGRSCRARGLSR
jgi:hypothetical protein